MGFLGGMNKNGAWFFKGGGVGVGVKYWGEKKQANQITRVCTDTKSLISVDIYDISEFMPFAAFSWPVSNTKIRIQQRLSD